MKTLALFTTKYAKLIIVLWVVFFGIMTLFAIRLPERLEGDGFSVKGDHREVVAVLTERFDLPSSTIMVVFREKTDADITEALAKIQADTPVKTLISPLTDASLYTPKLSYALLHFDQSINNISTIVTELRDLLKPYSGISLTGGPVIQSDLTTASQKDLFSAEAIGLPIALLVLLLAFGSVVASLLPIMIGVFTVVFSLGIMTMLGSAVSLSIFVLNIVPMLGLALSIDFALLFINRYREERAHSTVDEAVRKAIQTSGRSIVFSALCVMIGLAAMFVVKVDFFANIAIGGTIAVIMAVLVALTLLPAMICVLKDKLNKWPILRMKSGASGWHKFAEWVMRHPVKILITALLLLGIGIIPAKNIIVSIPHADALPSSYDSRTAFEELKETFKLGSTTTAYLLAERENGWTDEDGMAALLDIQQQLQADPLVDNVSTPFTATGIDSVEAWQEALQAPQIAPQLQLAQEAFIREESLFIPVVLGAEGDSSPAKTWVTDWAERDLGADISHKLGGEAKFNQEIFDETANHIGLAIGIIIISTFFILMFAFKSILIPIKAILMNMIGLGATFGILVYLFQYGHFGLEAGTISLIIPVIVFCLVFGLSMDYEVFLISRIQEEYGNSGNNTQATIEGLSSTSKIITSAALIMIVITGAFAFTDVMPVKQIGVGIAIAIAIDATIIRLLLVPSLMKLFGDWNWWMPFRSVSNRRRAKFDRE